MPVDVCNAGILMKTNDVTRDVALSEPAARREGVGRSRLPGTDAGQPSESLQARIDQSPRVLAQRRSLDALQVAPAQRQGAEASPGMAQANHTGMPDSLKAGIESLSGMDMSQVRVHRGSDKPAQLNALAYAQGNDIHLGPGQERHLPHEAWHVVQQRQGRVKPTMQMAGANVNTEAGLEREADRMGAQATAGDAVVARDHPATSGAASLQAKAQPVTRAYGDEIVQRQIGAGETLLYGRLVVDRLGRKYEIVGHQVFLGRLEYKLASSGGSTHFVRADDADYELYNAYEGVLGFDGREQARTPLEVTIRRRDGGPRTRTIFSNEALAKRVLVNECGVPEEVVDDLISKSDWSYPKVKELMALLSEEGTLQPGLDEGARLWLEEQPATEYTIVTTSSGSQLAQLVGCHLMEYQETNNGTQGPRQGNDESRQKQLELTRSILGLPDEQVALHAIGLGMPKPLDMFPASFDVKFEGGGIFSQPAGTSTFKIYQSSISNRDQRFDHTHTLDDDARTDRRDSVKRALADTAFGLDQVMPMEDVDFTRTYLGVKDTDSDHSMDEDEDWVEPLTIKQVGSWTLNQFHEFVYKHNVHSAVLLKEYAAKQAELDILDDRMSASSSRTALNASRRRRKRVQNQIERSIASLWNIMEALNINVNFVYTRRQQWLKKTEVVAPRTSAAAQEYKRTLKAYSEKSLLTLHGEGYPPPLNGIGIKTLGNC